MTAIARRWARALFEVSEARQVIDAVAGELASLDEILADAELRAIVTRAELPGSVVHKIVERLAEGRHELVRNLLVAIGTRRRLPVLVDLRAAFDSLVLASRGEVTGTVESARALGAAELAGLEAAAAKLSGKKVHLTVRENPGLIGGVRLRVGNTLWDGSVVAALEGLRERLLEVPIAAS